MTTATFLPHPLLRSCIQAYVYVDLDPAGHSATFNLFPTGYSMLVFLLNGDATFQDVQSRVAYNHRFHFVGQLIHHRQIQVTDSAEVCIVFKPAGAFRIFGQDQSCLVNDSFAFKDLMPTDAGEILHKLEDAGQNIKQVIRIMDNWLLKLWKRNDRLVTGRIEEAVRQISGCSGMMPIRSLCREIGMSKSSLEAHFNLKTGLSPKVYSRITRFNHAFRQMKENNALDWQELICRYNYFDQAHFIHEFKTFYGYTPSHIHTSFQNLAAVLKEQAEQKRCIVS